MRPFPRNSPQAAARIVALAMLADGQLTRDELEVIPRSKAHEKLGLRPGEFHQILHGLCDDLLAVAREAGADMCRVDAAALAAVMAEIDDRTLRGRILDLCVAVIDADGSVADGESTVLAAAVEHWGVSPDEAKVHGGDQNAASASTAS